MRRYLLVALWPAGLAAIAAATAVALRRTPAAPALAPKVADPGGNGKLGPARAVALLAEGVSLTTGPDTRVPDWLPGLVELGAISAAGGVGAYQLMVQLGRPVIKHGPKIDVPIFEWTSTHQVPKWAAIMERLNKIGNTWTTWGAAAAASACLVTTWRKQKWLPPSVFGAAIVVDHYATLALRRKFRRKGPPTSPLGTYPSGGCDRIFLFYGLTANMLWREFSGTPRGRIWALGIIAALGFNQAYCREYLSKHWFTDIATGVFYGAVLYTPFAVAIRVIAGPPNRPALES